MTHEAIRVRLRAAIPYEVPLSIAGHPEMRTAWRTDKDAEQILDAMVPVVEALLVEAREAGQ